MTAGNVTAAASAHGVSAASRVGGQFLVDLQHLADLAVLAVRGPGAGVFQQQAVPVDPQIVPGNAGVPGS